MSRYIASIIIFLLLIIGVLYVRDVTDDVTLEIISAIDDEIINAENEIYDGSPVIEAKKIWDDRRSFFSAVVPHDKLDSIDAQFALCNSWASSDEIDEYRAALWNLRAMISVIFELDSPSSDRII
ncbi:MAG: DUF4363 family protein [Clostridia bacterium]|nr:DUF4363 family protein [Clostridia bacterium]